MRAIELITGEKFSSQKVLREMLEAGAPGSGMSLGQMRRRLRILDALDALDPATDKVLQLEDADHQMLVELIDGFAFAIAHRDLVAVCEAVEKAAIVPAKKRVAAAGNE